MFLSSDKKPLFQAIFSTKFNKSDKLALVKYEQRGLIPLLLLSFTGCVSSDGLAITSPTSPTATLPSSPTPPTNIPAITPPSNPTTPVAPVNAHRVIDGAISGATVWRDANSNGIHDAQEKSVLTASDGSFNPSSLGDSGSYTSKGGTDVVTGKKFSSITMSTPEGSKIISPISTMINKYIAKNGGDAATAANIIKGKLGINSNIDILNYDPTVASNSVVANNIIAIGQKIIMAIDMLMDLGGMDFTTALEKIYDKIITNKDLANADTLKSLLVNSGNSAISDQHADVLGMIIAKKMTKMIDAVKSDGYKSTKATEAFKDIDGFNGKDGNGNITAHNASKLVNGDMIENINISLAQLVDGAKVEANFNSLVNMGITSFKITIGSLNLTVDQAAKVSATGNVVIKDNIANINSSSGLAVVNSSGVKKIEVTDKITIAELTTLKAITGIVNVKYAQVSDNIANINGGKSHITGDVNVNITDNVSLTQLGTIAGLTTGIVSAVEINGTAAELSANVAGYVKDDIKVNITDNVSLTQLKTIDGLTSGIISYDEITGAVAKLVINADGYVKPGVIVNISGDASLAQLLQISNAASTKIDSGNIKLTGTISDVAVNFIAVMAEPGFIKFTHNITITDNIDSANLQSIENVMQSGKLIDANMISINDNNIVDLQASTINGAVFTLTGTQEGKLSINNHSRSGDFIINGTKNDDVIMLGVGNDIINSGAGNDVVGGGGGADIIDVGIGRDKVVIATDTFGAAYDGSDIAALAASGDIIKGLLNSDGTGDVIDLTSASATATLRVADAADLTALGAITTGMLTNGFLHHNGALSVDWLDSNGKVNLAAITEALNIIQNNDTMQANLAIKGFIAIHDAGIDGVADMGFFYIKHADGNNKEIQAGEIQFIAVLEDFGTIISNGFIA